MSELKDIVRLTLQELDGLRLFDTVGHMDLSPANIFGTTGRAVFLDWAEAFVGDPLFSFEYLLQHFRRKFSRDCPSRREVQERLPQGMAKPKFRRNILSEPSSYRRFPHYLAMPLLSGLLPRPIPPNYRPGSDIC